MSTREQQLITWLQQFYSVENEHLESVSGDASFRKYYRFSTTIANSSNGHSNVSLIAVDSPPTHENNQAFIDISQRLEQYDVRVPSIHQYSPQLGFFVLSDFGDELLLTHLNATNADQYYRTAMDTLINLQTVTTQGLAAYSPEKLLQEMHLFTEWFLLRHKNLQLTPSQQSCLEHTYQCLVDNALEQPQAFVHRDYHSRNLMLLPDKQIGVIDYQDAVYGPITYDVVSLLRDCYIDWPAEKITAWLVYFHANIPSARTADTEQFRRWFDLMGLQRHLKAVGIFCRLNYRDNKSAYLNDIPRTLNYMLDVSANYSSLTEFHAFLTSLKTSSPSQSTHQEPLQ